MILPCFLSQDPEHKICKMILIISITLKYTQDLNVKICLKTYAEHGFDPKHSAVVPVIFKDGLLNACSNLNFRAVRREVEEGAVKLKFANKGHGHWAWSIL